MRVNRVYACGTRTTGRRTHRGPDAPQNVGAVASTRQDASVAVSMTKR